MRLAKGIKYQSLNSPRERDIRGSKEGKGR